MSYFLNNLSFVNSNYAKKIHKINFFLFSEYKPDIAVEDSTFEHDMKQFFMSEMLSDINFRVQNKYLRGKSKLLSAGSFSSESLLLFKETDAPVENCILLNLNMVKNGVYSLFVGYISDLVKIHFDISCPSNFKSNNLLA